MRKVAMASGVDPCFNMIVANEINIIIVLPQHLLCDKIHSSNLQTLIHALVTIAVTYCLLADVPCPFINSSCCIGISHGSVPHEIKAAFCERKTIRTASP